MTTTAGNQQELKLLVATEEDASWMSKGRRDFIKYRDSGLGDVTDGKWGAVNCRVTVKQQTGWHYHVCDLQAVYITKGWLELEFDDAPPTQFHAGTWLSIPPGKAHNETRTSDDCEFIEFTIPSKIETVPVSDPKAG